MTRRLEGRVAAVIGGGSGMGRAIALRLAGEGAHVHVADLSEAAAIAVADAVTDRRSHGASAHQLDATNTAALRGFFARPSRPTTVASTYCTTRSVCPAPAVSTSLRTTSSGPSTST